MSGTRGVTLIEMLIVLFVLAALASLAWPALRGSSARREARAFLLAHHAARLGALAGRAASLRWEDRADAFVLRDVDLAAPFDARCSGPVRRHVAPSRGVAVARVLRDGVVWLPDGSGRSCDGGGVYGGRVRFTGTRDAWDVVVASSGRLRMEPAP